MTILTLMPTVRTRMESSRPQKPVMYSPGSTRISWYWARAWLIGRPSHLDIRPVLVVNLGGGASSEVVVVVVVVVSRTPCHTQQWPLQKLLPHFTQLSDPSLDPHPNPNPNP